PGQQLGAPVRQCRAAQRVGVFPSATNDILSRFSWRLGLTAALRELRAGGTEPMPDAPESTSLFPLYARALFMWEAMSLYMAAGLARSMSAEWAILVAAAIIMPVVAVVVALVPRQCPEPEPEDLPRRPSRAEGFLGALIMWGGSALFMGPWLFGPAGGAL